jgi:hypothetical protein
MMPNQSLDSEPITWGFPVSGSRQEFGLHRPPWTLRSIPALSSCRSASVLVPITHHAARSKPLPVGMGPINSALGKSLNMKILHSLSVLIAALSIIFGAALIASGYAEISKFGSGLGYLSIIGGVILIVVPSWYVKKQQSKAKGK